MTALLTAENLRIQLRQSANHSIPVVDGLSFTLHEGEIFAIVGEPSCGKSTLAAACAGQLKAPLSIRSGSLKQINLGEGAILLQGSLTESLDPYQSVWGFAQSLLSYTFPELNSNLLYKRLQKSLDFVGAPELSLEEEPQHLTALERLQALLAMIHCISPRLIIADQLLPLMDEEFHEPTLAFFRKLSHSQASVGILWLCGNLKELDGFAHRISMLFSGEFVESGSAEQILQDPKHPFTRMLQARSQPITHPVKVAELRNPLDGCRFAFRCPIAGPECAHAKQLVRTVAERDVKCMYAQ